MRSYLIIGYFFLFISFANPGSSQTKTPAKKQNAISSAKVKNGIELEEHGLIVQEAFLMFEDKSSVPENNRTQVGKKINCILIISKGWKERDGKAFLGASEIIKNNQGQLILDEKDLLAAFTIEGISVENAGQITIPAIVTPFDKIYNPYVVAFKVWDKIGENYVSGSFKFYVK